MTRKIVIANQKGGCAKTTTVVNMAACLAEKGLKVLVIDLDPQSNTSQWLGIEEGNKGALNLLSTGMNLSELTRTTNIEGVDLICASQELADIEKVLSGKLAVETILKRRLASFDLARWDYLLFDTPPTLGLITLNALAAATELLVPVTTHVMTLVGVAQLMKTIEGVKEVLNPDLKVLGFLPARFDSRTKHSQEVLASLKEAFGDLVLKTPIRENVRLAEAPSFRESIVMYDPKSSASQDYRALVSEVIERA